MKIFLKNSGLSFLASSNVTLEKVKSLQYCYLTGNHGVHWIDNANYFLDVYDVSDYQGKQITLSAQRSSFNLNFGGYADGSIPTTGPVVTEQNVGAINNEVGTITLIDDGSDDSEWKTNFASVVPQGAKVLMLYRTKATDVTVAVVSLL